jgi:hypothetical protein
MHTPQIGPEIEYETCQELIEQQNEKQFEFMGGPTHEIAYN